MPAVLAITIGTFLVDLLAPALRLPDWVEQLALTATWASRWSAPGTSAGSSPASRSRSAGSRRCLGHAPPRRRDADGGRRVRGPTDGARAGCSSSTGSRPSRPAAGRTSGGSSASSARSTSSRRSPSCPTGRSCGPSSTGSAQRIRAGGGEASLLETTSPSRPGRRSSSPASTRPATPSTTRSSTASSASRTRSGARRARSGSGSPSSRRARPTGRSCSAGSPA